MTQPNPIIGRDLGRAICQHLGIDYHKHTVDSDFSVNVDPDKAVSVNLKVYLTPDDLAGIALAAGAEGWRVENARWTVEKEEEDIHGLLKKSDKTLHDARLNAEEVAANAEAARKRAEEAAEVLRRYGGVSQPSGIKEAVEEIRKLRHEMRHALTQVNRTIVSAQPPGE